MAPTTSPDLTGLLLRLSASGAAFILVGGLAAVAQGATITTFDVDIVPRRDEANIDLLLAFLQEVHAHYRGRGSSRLPPDRAALLGPGHSLFMTDLGPCDVLGALEDGKDFNDLLPDSCELSIGPSRIRVLSLAALVALKRGSLSEKDKLRLPMLEAALKRLPTVDVTSKPEGS